VSRGQDDLDPDAAHRAAGDGDRSAVCMDQLGHNGQAEAASAVFTGAGVIQPNEPLEYALPIGFGDAGPVVVDGEPGALVIGIPGWSRPRRARRPRAQPVPRAAAATPYRPGREPLPSSSRCCSLTSALALAVALRRVDRIEVAAPPREP
jgi:hypothetical protein